MVTGSGGDFPPSIRSPGRRRAYVGIALDSDRGATTLLRSASCNRARAAHTKRKLNAERPAGTPVNNYDHCWNAAFDRSLELQTLWLEWQQHMLCLLRLDCKSNLRLKSLNHIGFRQCRLNFTSKRIMNTPGSAAAELPPEETEEQRLLESQLYTAGNATENTDVLARGIPDGRSRQNGSSGDGGGANLWRAPAGELACRRVRMLAAIPQHDAHARCSLLLLAAAAFWNSGVAVALGSCVCFATAGALVKSPPIQVGSSRGVSWPLRACIHPDNCRLGLRSAQTDSHSGIAPPHTKQAVHEACQVWRLRRPAPPCRHL